MTTRRAMLSKEVSHSYLVFKSFLTRGAINIRKEGKVAFVCVGITTAAQCLGAVYIGTYSDNIRDHNVSRATLTKLNDIGAARELTQAQVITLLLHNYQETN